MKKEIGILLAAVMTAAFLGGCAAGAGSRDTVQESHVKESKDKKASIGLSFDSFVLERWLRDRDAFVSTAEKLGAEVNVQNANGDVKEQIEQIQYLIRKQVDVLVVVATDCQALSEVMLEAKDAGIKTISYDRLIQNADTNLYISFDNEKVGELMAEALAEQIPEGGEIFMLQGPEEDNNVKLVRTGFLRVLEKEKKLRVVYASNCEGWLAEQAVEALNEGLEEYPDVKGIMCGNDDIASRVVNTLAETRRAGTVAVTGQDGDLAACQRIVEGTQTMTAYKSVEQQAETAAQLAVKLVRGEELELEGETVNDGSYEIPSLILEPVAVTKENMNEIIVENGVHSREDVYLNVQDKGK